MLVLSRQGILFSSPGYCFFTRNNREKSGGSTRLCNLATLRADDDTSRAVNDTLRADGDTSRAVNDTLRADDDTSRAINDTLRVGGDTLRAVNDTLRAVTDTLRAKSWCPGSAWDTPLTAPPPWKRGRASREFADAEHWHKIKLYLSSSLGHNH
jgi:hypothetical protein